MTATETSPIFTPRPKPSGKFLTSQFLQLRCGACRHLFEAETPTNVDIKVWGKAVKRIACPACGSARVLMGQGRTPAEDDAFPWGATYGERVAGWLANGETGTSSEAIHERMSGRPQEHRDTPRDADDLNRCMLLLRRIPEWADGMGAMASVSPAWARLAARWDELAKAYREEGGLSGERGPFPRTRAILDATD